MATWNQIVKTAEKFSTSKADLMEHLVDVYDNSLLTKPRFYTSKRRVHRAVLEDNFSGLLRCIGFCVGVRGFKNRKFVFENIGKELYGKLDDRVVAHLGNTVASASDLKAIAKVFSKYIRTTGKVSLELARGVTKDMGVGRGNHHVADLKDKIDSLNSELSKLRNAIEDERIRAGKAERAAKLWKSKFFSEIHTSRSKK